MVHTIDAFSKFREATLLSKKCWRDGKFGHGMTWLVRKLRICENDLEVLVWWEGTLFGLSDLLSPAPCTKHQRPLKGGLMVYPNVLNTEAEG